MLKSIRPKTKLLSFIATLIYILLTAYNSFSISAFKDFARKKGNIEKLSLKDSLFFRELDFNCYSDSLKYFELKYGKNKAIIDELKEVVLIALSFYPELTLTNISFEYNQIEQTMNARPFIGNLVRERSNRKYCILINNNKGKNKGLLLETLSYNIVIGWLGHELSHIVAYEKLSNWQTIVFGYKYLLSSSYKRKVERYTDFTTIKHGLAYPLYDGVVYLLNSNSISDDYKQQIRNNYLSPEEIEFFWNKCQNGKNIFDYEK